MPFGRLNQCAIIPNTSSSFFAYTRSLTTVIAISRRFISTNAENRDLYQILGVSQTATQDEIKKAFYTLSKKYHPDVVGSNAVSAKKFLDVKDAYDTLKDEQKRREYDRLISRPQENLFAQQQARTHQYNYWQERMKQQQSRRQSSASIDEEFYRIWRTMQNDPEFQQATRKFNEDLKRMREQDYNQRIIRNFTRDNNAHQGNGRTGLEILKRLLIIYITISLVVSMITMLFNRNYGVPTYYDYEITRRNAERERIEKMMRKTP